MPLRDCLHDASEFGYVDGCQCRIDNDPRPRGVKDYFITTYGKASAVIPKTPHRKHGDLSLTKGGLKA